MVTLRKDDVFQCGAGNLGRDSLVNGLDDAILLAPFMLSATSVSTASMLYGIKHGEPWHNTNTPYQGGFEAPGSPRSNSYEYLNLTLAPNLDSVVGT